MEVARSASLGAIADALGLGEAVPCCGYESAVCCPFHDDTRPSLLLNETKGVWYCFPCAEGGDRIDLVQRVLDVAFPEAVAWICANSATRDSVVQAA